MTAQRKTYKSVNALLRGTMPKREAAEVIDGISELQTRQINELTDALKSLVVACTAAQPFGVRCPTQKAVADARRIARKHGAVFGRSNARGQVRD